MISCFSPLILSAMVRREEEEMVVVMERLWAVVSLHQCQCVGREDLKYEGDLQTPASQSHQQNMGGSHSNHARYPGISHHRQNMQEKILGKYICNKVLLV